jgi:hypothetical protein
MNGNDTPTALTSIDDIGLRLKLDGFAVTAGWCDAGMVNHLLDVSQRRSQEITAALGTQPIGIGSAAGFFEVVQRSPGRWDIPISPSEFGGR